MNYIAPGKRPLSSMCPTIIVNGDGVAELIIGAAGGSKITTSVASVSLQHPVFDLCLLRFLKANIFQTFTDNNVTFIFE